MPTFFTDTGSFNRLEASGSVVISPTFISPSTAAQSIVLITGSMQQTQSAGVQMYGVNITPTMIFTTASQTNTAFRIAPTFSGSAAFTSSQQNIIADFGATSVGTQFSVNDITSGSIYMVNDVSGLPILEATSDWTVNMYNYPTRVFQKTGSAVIVSGSLAVAGGSTTLGATTVGGAFTANSTTLLNGNITTGVGITMAFNGGGSGTRLTIGSTSLYKASNSTQTPNVIIAPNGTGGMGIVFDNDNSRGLVFCNGNTGFAAQAARASIRSVAVNNAVGSESGDLVFATSATATTLTDRMTITSTGNITVASGSLTITTGSLTMPNRPAFRVVGASVTGIPATTTLSGSATTVDYNQGGFYNNANGIFTASLAGLYHVFLNMRTNSGATQQAIVYRNATTASFMWEATGSFSGHFGVSGILNLAANDNLRVTVTVGTIQFDSNDSWGAAYIG